MSFAGGIDQPTIQRPVHQSVDLANAAMAADEIRARIYRLEDEVASLPQVELEIEHEFSDGIYMRTMFIPAATVLTGAVHRFDCLNVVVGDISVVTEFGSRRITAALPRRFSSPAGTKRAGYAHADTYWTTVHANPTNEQDPGRRFHLFAHNDRMLPATAAPELIEV